MRTGIAFSALIVVCAAFSSAQATHTGSTSLSAGAADTINTDSAATLDRGQWNAGLRVESTQFDRLSDHELVELREQDPEADLHSIDSLFITSLNAAFGVNENFTVGIKLPYVRRDDIREPPHGHDEGHEEGEGETHDEEAGAHEEGTIERLGDSKGLGDLSVYGLWRFHRNAERDAHAALLFGVKTPTGRTSERSAEGEKLETELQPGSGSWDPFTGLAFSRGFGSWTVAANLTYTFVTEGSQNTDLGDLLSYNGGLAYSVPWGGSTVDWDLVLELNGEWRDELEADSAADGNSGGHWLHLSPGLSVSGEAWSIFATVGLPIVDDPNGDQDERDYRLLLGVQFKR